MGRFRLSPADYVYSSSEYYFTNIICSEVIMYIRLVYDCYTTVEDKELDPDDPWARADTYNTVVIDSLRLTKEDEYQAIPLTIRNIPDEMFALVGIYSTGDSFGCDYEGEVEFISVHRTKKLAEKNKLALMTSDVIEHDNGKKETIYKPWEGYFNSLGSLEVYKLKVHKIQ